MGNKKSKGKVKSVLLLAVFLIVILSLSFFSSAKKPPKNKTKVNCTRTPNRPQCRNQTPINCSQAPRSVWCTGKKKVKIRGITPNHADHSEYGSMNTQVIGEVNQTISTPEFYTNATHQVAVCEDEESIRKNCYIPRIEPYKDKIFVVVLRNVSESPRKTQLGGRN